MILTLIGSFPVIVEAQDEAFKLEAEQNWDTYAVGGTCISGTHNIFVADVDSDGEFEIVTGGFTYNTEDGVRLSSQAPLKVWSWNSQKNVTLEASTKWDGKYSQYLRFRC